MDKKTGCKIFLTFAFILIQFFGFSQNVDSLKSVLKNAGNDTDKCKAIAALIEVVSDEEWPKYNEQLLEMCEKKVLTEKGSLHFFYSKRLADAYLSKGYLCRLKSDYAKAIEYYGKSAAIQKEINDRKGLSTSLFNTGVVYQAQSDNINAMGYFIKCKKIQEERKDKKGLSETYFSIGSLYDFLGDISQALDYYSKSLKMAEESNYKKVVAYALNNIGSIYSNLDDYPHALEYYTKSLKLYEENKDKTGIAISLNNIGGIYRKQGNIPKALDYFGKSFKTAEETGNKKEIANALSNSGIIYSDYSEEPDKALDCFLQSLKLQEEIGYKKGIANSLCNIGKVYLKKKNYIKAEEFAQKSLTVSKEIGFPQSILNAASLLDKIYEAQGKSAQALQMYKLFITMRDSINNTQTQKASIKREFQYNYDKKAAADSVTNAKEKEIKQAQINQQQAEIKAKRNQQYALYGGLVLVLIFSGFMYNRFKITHKQKIVIEQQEKETRRQKVLVEEQKNLIEEKHKEITDSINYAERIQRSFLASEQLLTDNLKDYFVFFQPKDVVSGDFYWASKLRNGNFVLATADSTGHGVPGAIMSILNISSLEKAVEQGLFEPSEIFNHTRKNIIERLKKDGSAEGGKDGMDCSLVSFDFKNKKLIYAAANNPVWIVRGNEILELAPDKMPVGKHDKDFLSFSQHEVIIQTGDVVYTLTDGMPDQFGGPKGKKFMYKQLKDLLISIAHLSMHEQKNALKTVLGNWKGRLEQVDDVCLIGVRI